MTGRARAPRSARRPTPAPRSKRSGRTATPLPRARRTDPERTARRARRFWTVVLGIGFSAYPVGSLRGFSVILIILSAGRALTSLISFAEKRDRGTVLWALRALGLALLDVGIGGFSYALTGALLARGLEVQAAALVQLPVFGVWLLIHTGVLEACHVARIPAFLDVVGFRAPLSTMLKSIFKVLPASGWHPSIMAKRFAQAPAPFLVALILAGAMAAGGGLGLAKYTRPLVEAIIPGGGDGAPKETSPPPAAPPTTPAPADDPTYTESPTPVPPASAAPSPSPSAVGDAIWTPRPRRSPPLRSRPTSPPAEPSASPPPPTPAPSPAPPTAVPSPSRT